MKRRLAPVATFLAAVGVFWVYWQFRAERVLPEIDRSAGAASPQPIAPALNTPRLASIDGAEPKSLTISPPSPALSNVIAAEPYLSTLPPPAVAPPAMEIPVSQPLIEDCRYRPMTSVAAVAEYTAILRSCSREPEQSRIAIRSFAINDISWLLLADPERLTTTIERSSCWSCRDREEKELEDAPYLRAVARAAALPGIEHRTFLQNAGLQRGALPNQYLTGDLCPSDRPLDRRFFEALMSSRKSTSLALSISGLWLKSHNEDFRWLMGLADAGSLDIVWVNHSFHHPYLVKRPLDQNFLLSKNIDADFEILETEKLLISEGGVPSVFFRFPGLISSASLMKAVQKRHLISLGADAWLAKGQEPHPGAIILVHPNGNEEIGIDMFTRLLSRGAFSEPFAPLTEVSR